MKTRMTLEERGNFAFKLQAQLLPIMAEEQGETAVLAQTNEQKKDLNSHASGMLAFELLLTMFRGPMQISLKDKIWSHIQESLRLSSPLDDACTMNKVLRFTKVLALAKIEETELDITISSNLHAQLVEKKVFANTDELKDELQMFMYEILYELVQEFCIEEMK